MHSQSNMRCTRFSFAIGILVLVATAGAPAPEPATAIAPEPMIPPASASSVPLESEPAPKITREQVGIASYYGRDFHGKRTASGEYFDMTEMTAAHRTLPFGTLARVTDLTNGRVVTVRINDRGPYRKGRIVDLSLAAARELGVTHRGVTRVRLEVIES